MSEHEHGRLNRSMGLMGATGIGVGAIVGGGILVLAGVAFASTGPSAIVAFAVNGVIALLTALSYAEMAAAFPESGGTYTFSKKVLSAPAGFLVGWVVWFASVVAAVLYALGFASFAAVALQQILHVAHPSTQFSFTSRWIIVFLAVAATAIYSFSLVRANVGGDKWATWGKVVVFLGIIFAGFMVMTRRPVHELVDNLQPFFAHGTMGLFKAMGYTFIALQGFDIIAAVSGEVKSPEKIIPRAMLLSLGISLAVYLPLLLVITTVGVPAGQDIVRMSLAHTDTIVAVAVQNYLGPFGYWLVMAAAILAMLSALRANLMAASRIAMSMAEDRTLPRFIARVSNSSNAPTPAIVLTMVMVMGILLVIPNTGAAGAAASLVFLISFALTHWIAVLAHMRIGTGRLPFLAPWFPLVPVIGGFACLGLAVFQGTQVPSAGIVCAVWLGLGLILYLIFFAHRARIVDASTAALNPELLRLRGHSPLVLVPIANPANADFMVTLATAMAPPTIGRVLLLSVVNPPVGWEPGASPPQLENTQAVLKDALTASFVSGLAPEALITVAPNVWKEIIRVARTYRCESLLIGLSDLSHKAATHDLERLMSRVDADVVVLRAESGWDRSKVKRVLVPLGGRGGQDLLRARLIGSLHHMGIHEITFLLILPENTPEESLIQSRKWLRQLADDEQATGARTLVICSNRPAEEIILQAAETDLLILGLQRKGRRRKVFGDMVLQIARSTSCGLILVNRKG